MVNFRMGELTHIESDQKSCEDTVSYFTIIDMMSLSTVEKDGLNYWNRLKVAGLQVLTLRRKTCSALSLRMQVKKLDIHFLLVVCKALSAMSPMLSPRPPAVV